MTRREYIEQLAAQVDAWARPHLERYASRVFFAAIEGECIRSAVDGRDKGVRIELPPGFGDAIQLRLRDRFVAFIWSRDRATVETQAGRGELITVHEPAHELVVPDPGHAAASAREQVDAALRVLFAPT